MRGFKDIAVLESDPCRHIYAPVTFSLFGRNQKLHKAALDTGCDLSSIPAQILDFGMAKDQAKEVLLLSNKVPLMINHGIEGALEDRSDLIKLTNRLNEYKRKCWMAKMSKEDTDKYIKENMTEDELSRVKNSKFTRFRVRVPDFTIANINLQVCPINIAFGTSESSVLIGMEIIQLLYMQTFKAGNKQYTLLAPRNNQEKIERSMSSAIRTMTNANKPVKEIPLK